ncbi:MAG: alpha/beta hydrolase [Candidatus Dormibacteraceae bacterium]
MSTRDEAPAVPGRGRRSPAAGAPFAAPRDVAVAPSWLAVNRLAQRDPLGAAEVDGFLAQHASPIVEGPYATFLWRGAAEQVLVRHAVIALPRPLHLRRLAGTDLWAKTIALPDSARVEYQLERVGGAPGAHRFNDPLNPRLGWGPFGAQSVCAATGYQDPEWAEADPAAGRGSLVDLPIASRSLLREVRVQVYLPAGFRPGGRSPLLVVHDGADFLQYAAFRTVLDNLIQRREVEPLVAAFVSAGPQRLVEYAADPRHAVFLVRELLPALFRRFRFVGGPDERTLMGSSFGGIAALSTAARYPGRFGSLLLESASLVFTDGRGGRRGGPAFAPVLRFVDAYRADPQPVVRRMFVSCGTFEPLVTPNRAMVQVFRRAGIDVRYEEAPDGHQWVAWRDRLRSALTFLHPGSLAGQNGAQR